MSLEHHQNPHAREYRLSQSSSTALDLVRILAAEAVVLGHDWSELHLMDFLKPPSFAYIQSMAVVIFFLLSGLLISYSVMTRLESLTFKEYLIDRVARIYSGLLPCILIIIALDYFVIASWPSRYRWYGGFNFTDLLANIFMLQDFPIIGEKFGITSLGSARTLWTLAIEWWIYMTFGWMVLSKRMGYVFWVVLIALLPVPLFNLVAGRGSGLTAVWMLGIIGYYILKGRSFRQLPWYTCIGTAFALAVAALARAKLTKEAYDVLFAFLALGSLIFLIIGLDATSFRLPDPLRTIVRFGANYSFTLYLLHTSCNEVILAAKLPVTPWVLFFVMFLASNFLSALVALGTEMRHPAVRRFLRKRLLQTV